MSTPRRDESGHGGSIVPINRPRANESPLPLEMMTTGMHYWEIPGTSMRGWTQHKKDVKSQKKSAQASTDAIMQPGDTMQKLNALIAKYGREKTAMKIGIGRESMRDWLNGIRQPGKEAKAMISREHYNAKIEG